MSEPVSGTPSPSPCSDRWTLYKAISYLLSRLLTSRTAKIIEDPNPRKTVLSNNYYWAGQLQIYLILTLLIM